LSHAAAERLHKLHNCFGFPAVLGRVGENGIGENRTCLRDLSNLLPKILSVKYAKKREPKTTVNGFDFAHHKFTRIKTVLFWAAHCLPSRVRAPDGWDRDWAKRSPGRTIFCPRNTRCATARQARKGAETKCEVRIRFNPCNPRFLQRITQVVRATIIILPTFNSSARTNVNNYITNN
jgi:hypothetical protein